MAKEQQSPEYRRALDEQKAREKQAERTYNRFRRQKAALKASNGFFFVSIFLTILSIGLVGFTGANSDSEGMLRILFIIFIYGGGLLAALGAIMGIVSLVMAVDEKAPGKDKFQSILLAIACAAIAVLLFVGNDLIVTLGMAFNKFIS